MFQRIEKEIDIILVSIFFTCGRTDTIEASVNFVKYLGLSVSLESKMFYFLIQIILVFTQKVYTYNKYNIIFILFTVRTSDISSGSHRRFTTSTR